MADDTSPLPAAVALVTHELGQHFGERLSTNETLRRQHAHTLTWGENQPPDAVVFAQNAQEVARVVTLCAEHGVPVIFGSGDDAFIEENQPLYPHAVFAETKKAYGANSGDSLTPQQSCVLLEERARQAVAGLLAQPASMPVLPLRGPLRCRLQVQSVALADLFSQLPILQRSDNVTVEFDAPTAEYAVRVLNSLSAMSAMLR
jgi:D-amino peptidase